MLLGARGDLRAARVEAILKEGGSWGKHGFPYGSEPQACDRHAANSSSRAVARAYSGSASSRACSKRIRSSM